MRHCPNCSSPITFLVFAYPRLSHTFTCPICRSRIKTGGIAAWISEAVLLFISFGVYSAVTGNWMQALVMLPIALVATYLEYRSVNLTLAGRIPPQ